MANVEGRGAFGLVARRPPCQPQSCCWGWSAKCRLLPLSVGPRLHCVRFGGRSASRRGTLQPRHVRLGPCAKAAAAHTGSSAQGCHASPRAAVGSGRCVFDWVRNRKCRLQLCWVWPASATWGQLRVEKGDHPIHVMPSSVRGRRPRALRSPPWSVLDAECPRRGTLHIRSNKNTQAVTEDSVGFF